jgi:hypothetical protein
MTGGELLVGVVGPSEGFDEKKASEVLREAYDRVEREFPGVPKSVVSRCYRQGVPQLAYREADLRGWKTVGIMHLGSGESLYSVDETISACEACEEGDELLKEIDVMVLLCAGPGGRGEAEKALEKGKMVLEYGL